MCSRSILEGIELGSKTKVQDRECMLELGIYVLLHACNFLFCLFEHAQSFRLKQASCLYSSIDQWSIDPPFPLGGASHVVAHEE